MRSSVQRFFERPLRPIEFEGQGQMAIWAAENYDPGNLVGISERFLGKADIYTATYTHSENILDLLRRAIALHGIPIGEMKTVLDFGSGPGTNTVLPLHIIDPRLRIVATDISLNLLAILSRLMDDHPYREHVDIVAWDCMSNGITPNSFDLVTGASLLHHLMDPSQAILTAATALRPGGYAFFVDPFDGAGLIRGLYQALLSANTGREDRLRDDTTRVLQMLVRDYGARLAGSLPEHFTELEDKWIFSQELITQWGHDAGFRSVCIRGTHDDPHMYRNYVMTQIRMASGPDAAKLPAWAVDVLDGFDASLTAAVRNRMILEGIIVMRK
jgi:SAM-dependent methyltransferase